MENDSDGQELSLLPLIRDLLRRKWWILLAGVAGALVGLVVSLTNEETYSATSTIYPIASDNSQLSSLASVLGVSVAGSSGKGDSSRSIFALLQSRLFATHLIEKMNLLQRLYPQVEATALPLKLEAATAIIQSAVTYAQVPSTGVLSFTVSLNDPVLARDVANGVLAVLDELLVDKSLNLSNKVSESLSRQIVAQRARVEDLQSEVAKFQQDTSMLDPRQSSFRALGTYEDLVQRRMNLQLQLETARGQYSEGNTKVRLLEQQILNISNQISELKTQEGGDIPSIKTAPETMIRFQNLTRELDIATKIYASLLASLDQAKLQDAQDQVFVEPLDLALTPKRSNQKFETPIILGFAMGVILAMALVLAWRPVVRFLSVIKT